MIQAMIPIFLYEMGAIGFWLLIFPAGDLAHVHYLAWRQDIPILLVAFSALYFAMGLWYHFYLHRGEEGD